MRRIRLYSLRTINDRSILNFDLTGLIVTENQYSIEVKTPKGIVTLDHYDYLNKMKVYDDGELFFIVCTKRINQKYAFKFLMNYAMEKVDKTIEAVTNDIQKLSKKVEKLSNFKTRLQTELVAA